MALITKSQQLASQLREEIQAGRWAPSERLPGELEMQEQFGISRTTIRDALNTLAGEGLVVRKHGTGTYVADNNKLAFVAIAADASRLASPLGYWYRSLVESAQKRIADAGYRAVIAVGNGKTPEEFVETTNILNSIKSTNIVGVIDTSSVPFLSETLSNEGVNTVVVECAVPTSEYSIVLDYSAFTKTCVDLLKSAGYDDFAVLHYDFGTNNPHEVSDPVWREMSRLRMQAIDNDYDRWIPVSGYGYTDADDKAYEAFINWWKGPKKTNSILFFDDTVFDMASKAIIELGIKVPDDLAILTHANVGRHFHFPVKLTRVGFDAENVMKAAWDMLDKLIKKEPLYYPTINVKPTVQAGESLGEERKPGSPVEADSVHSEVGAWSRS